MFPATYLYIIVTIFEHSLLLSVPFLWFLILWVKYLRYILEVYTVYFWLSFCVFRLYNEDDFRLSRKPHTPVMRDAEGNGGGGLQRNRGGLIKQKKGPKSSSARFRYMFRAYPSAKKQYE